VQLVRDGKNLPVILRLDPASSIIDTERALEFAAYKAVYGTSIPVPAALFLEEDLAVIGRPFSVMEMIEGCEASPDALLMEPYVHHREKIAEQVWSILGRLAAMDADNPVLLACTPKPAADRCALEQVEYWAKVIRDDAMQPQPVAEASIRYLQSNPPPPPQKLAIVHGDYRSGNFLFNTAGEIKGVLDWEMCHIGDPLEDLAWSLDPLWSWPDRELAGKLVSRQQAISYWQAASGMTVDLQAFKWWQVFASVKGLAIWISSIDEFMHSDGHEPITALAGWVMSDRQNRILVDQLQPNSPRVYSEDLTTLAQI
jgi:aminoglycoside phosphotransferase (APT) family kinase protein